MHTGGEKRKNEAIKDLDEFLSEINNLSGKEKLIVEQLQENLSPKQKIFAELYACTMNGSESARKAGYLGSANDIAMVGSDNIKKPHIKAYIKFLVDKRSKEIKMTSEDVLKKISAHAEVDVDDFYDFDEFGNARLNLLKAKAAGKTHLIKRIFKDRNGNDQIELHNVQSALSMLARHFSLFQDTVRVNISDLSEEELLNKLK